jgi:glycosyltransferase involved in cell wall biosynthesis
LVGPVSNLEKKTLLSKSWIFVNPSIGEGWSIAVIEANLHGTPAISFQVPGLTESIQPGKTGFWRKIKKISLIKYALCLPIIKCDKI